MTVTFCDNVSHDQLHAAADFLGIPWDVSARRDDGTPYWEKAGSHALNSSHAVVADSGDVGLFYDHDAAAVTAPEGHPIWGAVRAVPETR